MWSFARTCCLHPGNSDENSKTRTSSSELPLCGGCGFGCSPPGPGQTLRGWGKQSKYVKMRKHSNGRYYLHTNVRLVLNLNICYGSGERQFLPLFHPVLQFGRFFRRKKNEMKISVVSIYFSLLFIYFFIKCKFVKKIDFLLNIRGYIRAQHTRPHPSWACTPFLSSLLLAQFDQKIWISLFILWDPSLLWNFKLNLCRDNKILAVLHSKRLEALNALGLKLKH